MCEKKVFKIFNSPSVRKIGRDEWELLEDFHVMGYVVPKGFITDGASVPRIFWWFARPSGEIFEAAILHDYLYSGKDCLSGNRSQADNMFLSTMGMYNVETIKSHLIFLAVRMFGWYRWDKIRVGEKEG